MTNREEEVVYDGFHTVIRVKTEMKGKTVFREKLGLKSSVAALVTDEDGRIALVSQYRPVPNVQSIELPAGLLDKKGLTPIEILLEELKEECHLTKKDIISVNENPFDEYYTVIGSSDARIQLYEINVKNQNKSEIFVDDADVDMVKWYTFEEVDKMIKNGSIVDSKTRNAFNYLKIKKLEEKLILLKK